MSFVIENKHPLHFVQCIYEEFYQLILVNALLPQSLGLLLKHQKISHTCLHVRSSDFLLAVGSNAGHFWIIDMQTRKLIKELSVKQFKCFFNCIYLSHSLQDGKSPLKILRFHSEYSLIATATEDGMVTVINFIKPSVSTCALSPSLRQSLSSPSLCQSMVYMCFLIYTLMINHFLFISSQMKQLMMEREQKSVTAMEWAQEKDCLFVGYNSGKVLSFSVQFDKVCLAVVKYNTQQLG